MHFQMKLTMKAVYFLLLAILVHEIVFTQCGEKSSLAKARSNISAAHHLKLLQRKEGAPSETMPPPPEMELPLPPPLMRPPPDSTPDCKPKC